MSSCVCACPVYIEHTSSGTIERTQAAATVVVVVVAAAAATANTQLPQSYIELSAV